MDYSRVRLRAGERQNRTVQEFQCKHWLWQISQAHHRRLDHARRQLQRITSPITAPKIQSYSSRFAAIVPHLQFSKFSVVEPWVARLRRAVGALLTRFVDAVWMRNQTNSRLSHDFRDVREQEAVLGRSTGGGSPVEVRSIR